MKTEIDEVRAFNLHRAPAEPVDWEPRLRGDILIWQVIDAYVAPWLVATIAIIYGLARLALWELPKLLLWLFIIEPIKRWYKR